MDTKYFVKEVHVASSVTVIPVLEVEKTGISVDDQKEIEDFVLNQIYRKAERSELSMSAMEWTEEETDKPKTSILIVMDDVLSEGDHAVSYHKYWMDGNWYRFSMERRR